MKKIFNLTLGLIAASSVMFTGCIDETMPTSGVTNEQLAASPKAAEAMLWGMPAFTNKLEVLTDQDFDWGYGSMMHIRDCMTGDYAIVESNYDHYTTWENNEYMGMNYLRTQFFWNYYTKFLLTANNMVGALEPSKESLMPVSQGYLGAAYAYRAFIYLDMARMFEYLPCDVTTGVLDAPVTVKNVWKDYGYQTDKDSITITDVTNFTVPLVTPYTTEAEASHNPRAPREVMAKFIESDLQNAIQLLPNLTTDLKTLPHLDVAYGLMARLYMWIEDYDKAYAYADSAIQAGNHKILTKAEWLDPTTGFNTLETSSWMLGSQMTQSDDVVQTGILNWTSWASNETYYGYAAAGPMSMISASTYARISDTDFRKLSWKAPAKTALAGQETFIDPDYGTTLPDYASLKFRPGQGNMDDYTVGSACAYPLMRIEEMYFIKMEALAHKNPSQGLAELTKFMVEHRDPKYAYTGLSDAPAILDEIFFQKCVELWGEGLTFFDYKRLNKSVTRYYPGTNFPTDAQMNTNGRPAWMTICIVQTEQNSNSALMGCNNPDPSDKYSRAGE